MPEHPRPDAFDLPEPEDVLVPAGDGPLPDDEDLREVPLDDPTQPDPPVEDDDPPPPEV